MKTRSAPAKKKNREIPEELRLVGNTVYEKTSFELDAIESIYGTKVQEEAPSKHKKKTDKPVKKAEKAPKPEKKASKPKKNTKKAEENFSASNHKAVKRTPVKIIPLGGLNEIGKNMTAFECGNDIFMVDCGLAFPDNDMPGVDLVIPDFTYVVENRDRVRGIIITHGHEDHIGGLAYLLQKVNMPVYATKLTIALINGKLAEHGLDGSVKLVTVQPRETVKMGCMTVEFIKVNHSIPDSVGLAIHTPAGIIIHTGDFKVDFTPIDGGVIDLARFGELGSKGVLALMSDSTNAERPGHTASERTVGDSFERLFARADGKRIIVATFASNVHRVQQIINNAVATGRKVAIFGRSMQNTVAAAAELGYLDVTEDIFIDVEMMNKYPPEKVCLITTGSQGETMSALTRMAMGEHRSVSITPRDYIIISATPIPGNEKYVTRVVNELLRQGAEVIYESMYDVHVSGHACQEEIKLIMALTRPRFFIPVHGEYKHLRKNASLAHSMGIPPERVIVGSIGDVIETDGVNMAITGKVQAGKVLVDGLGVGDVGSVVLRDRKHLAEDGLIVVACVVDNQTKSLMSGPDIVSRGFVYVRENEELMDEARKVMKKTLERLLKASRDWNTIKTGMRDDLSEFIYRKTGRDPMILPIIEEV
ncbi:MAG: ribonuclease J [Oscillospiraceae bacterium]|nr:ribonuclease J [Oscillospiraceae bacterium]MBQ8979777.1 ribonuclease J [Oscillospiraceae bacterium]